MNMKKQWWKALGVILLGFSIIGGLLVDVPALPILNESIRNLFFHVPMWFGMILILGISTFHSIRFLAKNQNNDDLRAMEASKVGLLFGSLGMLTGMVWAKITWGAWWVGDPRLNGAAITLLIYLAYLVLTSSFEDKGQRARVSAVYAVFAYVMLIVFLIVLPRLTDSLHPGAGGNPGFSNYDLDNTMRIIFYPAVAGWFIIGCWIINLRVRMRIIEDQD